MRRLLLISIAVLIVTWMGVFSSNQALASSVNCNNISTFNSNSQSAAFTATLLLNPTGCNTPASSGQLTLADLVTADVPVIGTSAVGGTGFEPIRFRFKAGVVSNVFVNGVLKTDDSINHDLRKGANTISFDHAVYGELTVSFEIENDEERIKNQGSATAVVITTAPPADVAVDVNEGSTAGGTPVTITGKNFFGATSVRFGSVEATFTVVDAKKITVTAPAQGSGLVDITVTTPCGSATGTNLFTYIEPANVASISPDSGPTAGGTAITISGSKFTGTTAVTIGGVSATSIVVVNDAKITAVTPAGTAGPANVAITTNAGTVVATVVFTYTEPIEKTQKIIASYLQDRANNLLNTRPDITSFLYEATSGGPLGNLQLNANAQDFNLTFSSSLGRIMRVPDSQPSADEPLNGSNAYDPARLAANGELDYDLWVQIHGAKTRSTDANSTLWVGQFGGHAFLDENTLVGAMVQFDWADQSQRNTAGKVDGLGWMVGPYFAAKMPDQSLAFDAFVTWGRSDNNVSSDGTYTDKFETERWMANAKLSGVFESNGWTIQPAIEISYFKETQFSYVDSQNSTIPEQSISMGEMRFGPSVSKQWTLDDGTVVQPSLGVAGVWNFAIDKEGLFPSSGQTSNDLRARFEVGLTIGRENEWALNVSGYYDGVGTDSFESYGGKLRLTIPLP